MITLIVDERLDTEEENNLKALNVLLLKCPKSSLLYDAVAAHPDMNMHVTGEGKIIIQKDMEKNFLNSLEALNIKFTKSKNSLKNFYPYDIILNGLSLGHLFLHNIKNTDDFLLDLIKDKKIISVSQGYTKCSCAIVSNKAVITSDVPISNALKKEGFDVLLVPPGDILLPGLDYGFIGGTCGLVTKDTLAFYGDLDFYKYGEAVKDFLNKHGIKYISLRHGPLIDRGSILKI